MWSHEPGPVSEHVEMLGNMAFPCFSVTGKETALFDAGITVMQPEKAFQINLASMIRSILAERGEKNEGT